MKDINTRIFPDIETRRPLIIAGPCSAESLQQTLSTARQIQPLGIKIFRAGIWKPRTKPGYFEGVGAAALEWMKQVKEQTGMYTATEVATEQHVKLALSNNIDMLWIGARTVANPFSIQQIADALHGTDIPVFVKNPVNPDLDLWIGAMERLYNAGIRRIGAIHRGFTTYEKHTYRNPPQWHIPIELRRRIPQLPILCDPSHISGNRTLIEPLCQQAMDLGFDGLFIESHCNPDTALSDAAQQLTPTQLQELLSKLIIRDTCHISEKLTELRRRIDQLDNDLIDILAERMRVAREIGHYKIENDMPILQANRYDEILTKRIAQAQERNMSTQFIKTLLEAIHEESIRHQLRIFNSKK